MARRLVILGSTGSIGVQALDVVARAAEGELEVVGLSAGSDWRGLLEQARRHGVRRVALADPDAAAQAAEAWTEGEVLAGPDGLVALITEAECDLVLNGIVGSAGLVPTVAALGEGIDLALANKESLVVGGELVTALAEATGAAIIPVDSEHSALHQLLAAEQPGTVARLILTASGGPFRGRRAPELEDVTVEQALAHPTWTMGGKITIDSATLMNKGLELIEAHHLFGTPYADLDVIVHPQSIVHSLVQLCDGATLAHLGYPDMRVPISYGLHYPQRVDVPVRALDLAELGALTFEPADEETFACLRLAREAGLAGGTAPCTLNAANEIAVHAFLGGRLRFLQIAEVIEETLSRLPGQQVHSFDSLAHADAQARRLAGELVESLCGLEVFLASPATLEVPLMSYVLAFLGFAALIILHEAGHFVAAKAVGMRVERFSLFFGPLLVKKRWGETEYGIGPIPLGGYVKISGMNPNEEIPPEVVGRAYYNQPVWKRVVTILAGPAVNILIAFFIIWGLLLSQGQQVPTTRVAAVVSSSPAAAVLHPGDQVVSVNGVHGSESALRTAIGSDRCAGTQANGCHGARPLPIVVRRDGQLVTVQAQPRYVAADNRMELGFEFGARSAPISAAAAASDSANYLWYVTRTTVSTIARIFQPQERKQLSSVVGGYKVTQQSFATGATQALTVLALISLSLGVINLFPFLPLDGGHVFWALAEKVRGKRIPFSVMERAGVVGFALIILLFVIGLSNDISTLSGPGFHVPR